VDKRRRGAGSAIVREKTKSRGERRKGAASISPPGGIVDVFKIRVVGGRRGGGDQILMFEKAKSRVEVLLSTERKGDTKS